MARIISVLFFLLELLTLCLTAKLPEVDYDVMVIGGGPAGLSAVSAFCRVARKVIMFDHEVYRNAPTRHMHDVIGNDGTRPAEFRALARKQIDKYGTATTKKAKVVDIIPMKSPDGPVWFAARDETGTSYTARRVILASGVKDLLPQSPGVLDAFGQGMYWCPWCDGYEHRNQSLAVLGPLEEALNSALEMHLINPDIVVLTNGTDTPEQRANATKRSSTWDKQLAAYNIPIVNTTIDSITRLRDGNGNPVQKAPINSRINRAQQYKITGDELNDNNFNANNEYSGPNGLHKDLFRVNFVDGSTLERGAFLINIPVRQTTDLPMKMGLSIKNAKIEVDGKMKTNISGVYAVGDANSDGSTNVPHAMFSGKRAAVVAHVEMSIEESLAFISKRDVDGMMKVPEHDVVMRTVGDELERLWDGMK